MHNKKVTITCVICGATFQARDTRTKSCSAKCRDISTKATRAAYDERHKIGSANRHTENRLDLVVRAAWLKGDATERIIIEAHNPGMVFP